MTRAAATHTCRRAGRRFPIYVVIHPTLRRLRHVLRMPDARAAVWEKRKGEGRLEVHLFIGNTLDEVAHEAVHLAFALRRRGCRKWHARAGMDEEETMAYPVGEITLWLWQLLNKEASCQSKQTRGRLTSPRTRRA